MQMAGPGGTLSHHKRSGEHGYGTNRSRPIASAVSRWRRLLPVAAWIAAPAAGSRNAPRSLVETAISHPAGFSARLFHDERAGERGPDQALDGSDRLRPYGS